MGGFALLSERRTAVTSAWAAAAGGDPVGGTARRGSWLPRPGARDGRRDLAPG